MPSPSLSAVLTPPSSGPSGGLAQRAPWSTVGLVPISERLPAPDPSRCPTAAVTCLLGLFCGHQVLVIRTVNTSLHRSRPPCPSRLHKEPTLCNSPPHLPCALGTPATLLCSLWPPRASPAPGLSPFISAQFGPRQQLLGWPCGSRVLVLSPQPPTGRPAPPEGQGRGLPSHGSWSPRPLADPRGGQGETMSQINCFLGVTGQRIGPPAGQLGPRNPGSTPSSAAHAL